MKQTKDEELRQMLVRFGLHFDYACNIMTLRGATWDATLDGIFAEHRRKVDDLNERFGALLDYLSVDIEERPTHYEIIKRDK